MKKKVLTLTVSKQWFDMIMAGEKTEEYREIKAYWINRLIQAKYGESDEYRKVTMHPEFDMLISNSKLKELLEKKTARFIPYTYVRFFHGYAKNRPWIEKEIESITIGKPKKGLCPDKWLDTEFFIIKFKQRMDKELKDKMKLYRAMRNAKEFFNSTALSLEDISKGLKELVKYR